jgi:CHAD domain-containing protein
MQAENRADDAARALRAIAERADGWPLERLTWATVREDGRKIYARGRDEFATACDSDDGDVLHEWRKRVKDLWYQQRLLRDAWNPVLRAYADQADELGEALGDDHDLAVLAGELESRQDQLSARLELERMLELIARRRGELQSRAVAIGARLYAEKPSAYGRRTGAYIKAARNAVPGPSHTRA